MEHPRRRLLIVPTGPESFAGEMLTIDGDFFGGCCPDCAAAESWEPVPLDDSDDAEPCILVVLP